MSRYLLSAFKRSFDLDDGTVPGADHRAREGFLRYAGVRHNHRRSLTPVAHFNGLHARHALKRLCDVARSLRRSIPSIRKVKWTRLLISYPPSPRDPCPSHTCGAHAAARRPLTRSHE